MHYWHSVLGEVLNKTNKNQEFFYTEQGALHISDSLLFSEDEPIVAKEKRDLRTYYLKPKYPDVYFTKREAECIFWMMHGLTIAETALKMYLSPRTIEYYVKNMKIKLGCASKKRLIEKVMQTSLMDQLKQEGMQVVLH